MTTSTEPLHRPMSLQTRLMTAVIGFVSLILVIVAVITSATLGQTLEERLDAQVRAVSSQTTALVQKHSVVSLSGAGMTVQDVLSGATLQGSDLLLAIATPDGFSGVLATNCEQSYVRYLRVDERVHVTTALESVVGPKTTAMGVGYFVTSRNTWYVDTPSTDGGDGSAERVATMLFRVLKFVPKGAAGEAGKGGAT